MRRTKQYGYGAHRSSSAPGAILRRRLGSLPNRHASQTVACRAQSESAVTAEMRCDTGCVHSEMEGQPADRASGSTALFRGSVRSARRRQAARFRELLLRARGEEGRRRSGLGGCLEARILRLGEQEAGAGSGQRLQAVDRLRRSSRQPAAVGVVRPRADHHSYPTGSSPSRSMLRISKNAPSPTSTTILPPGSPTPTALSMPPSPAPTAGRTTRPTFPTTRSCSACWRSTCNARPHSPSPNA